MRIKAVIVDVDGTLYRQRPVRLHMMARLFRSYLPNPAQGIVAVRVLRAYRRAQEVLRTASWNAADLAEQQLELACRWSRTEPETARRLVARWMEKEPLDLLPGFIRHGAKEFLTNAKRRGLRLGVFSDYPAAQKLTALKLSSLFDTIITAQHREVQKFKPEPRGLEVALHVLGVGCEEALYVGDRPELDAAAASRAGMNCAIIGASRRQRGANWLQVAGFPELAAVLGV